jgi:putative membrane protein insertion efficiency factor
MIARLAAALRTALSLLVILPVRFYQVVLGPLLPKVCIYYPSCSDYFILAVRKYGPTRGTCKGVWRICRCNPFNRGGYDPP